MKLYCWDLFLKVRVSSIWSHLGSPVTSRTTCLFPELPNRFDNYELMCNLCFVTQLWSKPEVLFDVAGPYLNPDLKNDFDCTAIIQMWVFQSGIIIQADLYRALLPRKLVIKILEKNVFTFETSYGKWDAGSARDYASAEENNKPIDIWLLAYVGWSELYWFNISSSSP